MEIKLLTDDIDKDKIKGEYFTHSFNDSEDYDKPDFIIILDEEETKRYRLGDIKLCRDMLFNNTKFQLERYNMIFDFDLNAYSGTTDGETNGKEYNDYMLKWEDDFRNNKDKLGNCMDTEYEYREMISIDTNETNYDYYNLVIISNMLLHTLHRYKEYTDEIKENN